MFAYVKNNYGDYIYAEFDNTMFTNNSIIQKCVESASENNLMIELVMVDTLQALKNKSFIKAMIKK